MSMYFGNRLNRFLMDKAGGDGGGGAPDLAKDFADLKTMNAQLIERLNKLEASKNPDPKPDDPELIDKAKKQKAESDKKALDSKALESALKFSIGAPEFLKNNASLLPKDVADIFKTAEKENFSDAMEKDAAIKSGIIQSFFSVQHNMDLLTPGVKTVLEDYLKLTKTGKQEKAQQIYDTVFEPAFEMLKRVKKAEALNKGLGSESDSETAYKNKLIAGSKRHYLGEKSDA